MGKSKQREPDTPIWMNLERMSMSSRASLTDISTHIWRRHSCVARANADRSFELCVDSDQSI
jgi:hypothetical protein